MLVEKGMWIMTVGMCAVTYARLDKPWVDSWATNRGVALVSDRYCLLYRPLYYCMEGFLFIIGVC